MKKIILILTLFLTVHDLAAKTIRVGKQQFIKTIQRGLLLAAAGDTVMVDAGHYHEKNIIISRMPLKR